MATPFTLRRGGAIGGFVRDAEGLPVAGAEVFGVTAPVSRFGLGCVVDSFQAGDDSLPVELSRGLDEDSVHAVSGSDGSFRLVDLAEGPWTIYAMASGHESGRGTEVPHGAQDVSIVLLPEARWHVRVIDASSGLPVSGVRVEARRMGRLGPLPEHTPPSGVESTWLGVLPDEDGALGSCMIPGAGPAGTQLVVWARGYLPQRLILAGVAPGTERTLDVRLSPEAMPR